MKKIRIQRKTNYMPYKHGRIGYKIELKAQCDRDLTKASINMLDIKRACLGLNSRAGRDTESTQIGVPAVM